MICQSLDLSSCHPRGSNVNNPWAQAEPSTQPFISLLLSVPGTGAFVFSLRPETLQELHGKDLLSFSFCLCEQLRLTGWGQEKVQLRGVCCSVRPSREGMLFPSVLAAAIWKKKKKSISPGCRQGLLALCQSSSSSGCSLYPGDSLLAVLAITDVSRKAAARRSRQQDSRAYCPNTSCMGFFFFLNIYFRN